MRYEIIMLLSWLVQEGGTGDDFFSERLIFLKERRIIDGKQ